MWVVCSATGVGTGEVIVFVEWGGGVRLGRFVVSCGVFVVARLNTSGGMIMVVRSFFSRRKLKASAKC